jgi:hypothetical protein
MAIKRNFRIIAISGDGDLFQIKHQADGLNVPNRRGEFVLRSGSEAVTHTLSTVL